MSKRIFDLSNEILTLEAQLDNEELTDDQRHSLVDAWLERTLSPRISAPNMFLN